MVEPHVARFPTLLYPKGDVVLQYPQQAQEPCHSLVLRVS